MYYDALHSIQVGLLTFEQFKGSLFLKHPDVTLDITSIEKDPRKTSFSIPAKCLSGLKVKCCLAGCQTIGICVLVHCHTYYCVKAVKWFCQELLFCGVSVAADPVKCRCIPDIIKPIHNSNYLGEGGKKTASAGAKVFSSHSPSFPLQAVPVLRFITVWVIPSCLGTEASSLVVLPAARLPQTVFFFLLSHHFRGKNPRDFSGLWLLQKALPAPYNLDSPHHPLSSLVSP